MKSLLTAALLVLAVPAFGQEVLVRSGEHEEFTRLVVMLPAGSTWTLEADERGYRLETPGAKHDYDLTNVFRFIPKTRVQGISAENAGKGLSFSIPETVVAEAFQLSDGPVVIDFREGTRPQPLQERSQNQVALPMPSRPLAPNLDKFLQSRSFPVTESLESAETSPETTARAALPLEAPDPRIQKAESELLEQLSRAASQGLLSLDIPKHEIPKAPGTETSETQPPAPSEEPTYRAADHIAIQSETAIDRETLDLALGTSFSDSGAGCWDDTDVDPASWIDDRPPETQIGEARRALVGEFDEPQVADAIKLAQIYVAYGFGFEARSVLQSLDIPPDQSAPINELAKLVDEQPVGEQSDLRKMGGCDGKVALWALLASESPKLRSDYNVGAIQRAYSSLPPVLRTIIGERLVERLIAIGARDIADSIRLALQRGSGQPSETLNLVEARVAHAEGAPEKAEPLLEKLVKNNDNAALTALILLVQGRLERGEAVDDATIDQTGGLAYELLPSDDGIALLRAHMLGLGSVGRFGEAFSAMQSWPEGKAQALQQETTRDLFAQLADVPDDAIFLRSYFAQSRRVPTAALSRDLRVKLANRLLDQGFGRAARAALGAEAFSFDAGRVLLARAALEDHDAPSALAHLDGVPSPEAEELRAHALKALGEHMAAQAAFRNAGNAEAAVAEAWRAGDWASVGAGGAEEQQRIVELYGLAPPATPETDPAPEQGLLTKSRSLLEQSKAEREAFGALMDKLSTEDQ
mgnify:CR=1 FL=1